MNPSNAVLEAEGLLKTYEVPDPRKRFGRRWMSALDGVSIRIEGGKTTGLVGESGSGKSTLARVLVLLEKSDAGQIRFLGRPVPVPDREKMRDFRRGVGVVFQDPAASLNPRMNVGRIVAEPLTIHRRARREETAQAVESLLKEVGLDPRMAGKFPHQLSGGEKQRVAIARAIALKPRLLVCDEAVSSLDVLVRAQILNLLLDLQQSHDMAYLFISHDLGVVRHMSDTIYVMKDGKIVERGPAAEVFDRPRHEYTRRLFDSVS